MDTRDPNSDAFRNLISSAGETLDLLCRLRGIELQDLTDDELGAFFIQAMGGDA